MLGRRLGRPSEPYPLADLTVDYTGRRVAAGNPVQLTPTKYGLIYELTVNANPVLTH